MFKILKRHKYLKKFIKVYNEKIIVEIFQNNKLVHKHKLNKVTDILKEEKPFDIIDKRKYIFVYCKNEYIDQPNSWKFSYKMPDSSFILLYVTKSNNLALSFIKNFNENKILKSNSKCRNREKQSNYTCPIKANI